MPLFVVTVTRRFESRHVHERVVEAENRAVAKAWVEEELENGEFDPSDDYTEQDSGYDDAGSWGVEDYVKPAVSGPPDTIAGEVQDDEEDQGHADEGPEAAG